jgi:diacylglycerol kinase family enzyme
LMRGLLLYNPLAGRDREVRASLVQRIAKVLRSAGYELEIAATTHRGSAGEQARTAITNGAEVVFACGGDGTVHDVLQGVAGTEAALAVIPMGSANALARELKIPTDPLAAARGFAGTTLLDAPVGRCVLGGASRAFLVMAGAGPDGALMYRMLTVDRSRWGRWAYAVHALRLLLRGRFRTFPVCYQRTDGTCRTMAAVSVLAMRVGALGGIFPGIARGASLLSPTMRVAFVKAPAVLGLPLWFAMNWLGLERWNPLLVKEDVSAFVCEGHEAVHAQVDGEWIGRLPMRVTLGDETVRLLVPVP